VLKGIKPLREHFPDLRSPVRSAWIGILAGGLFGLTIIFFTYVKRYIPDWSLDGQVVIVTIGFLWLRMFFTHKKNYVTRYGELAYRNAFMHFTLPGLALIFATVAHISFMPGPAIPRYWWAVLFPYFGWYFVIIGAILWLRAVYTFGIDNLTMLYVYFPEQSRQVNSNIYSILRHPVYAGGLRLAIGLALLNANAFSLFFSLIVMPLILFSWVRLVEEKELVERFGTGYSEYRQKTPAFWPRPRNLVEFFRFLLKG